MLKGNLVASRQNRFPSIYSYYHNNILLQLVIPKILELKEENPIKADAIQQIISNIELKAETFEAPSMIKYYVCVAVVSALSIFIVLVLSLSWWKAVLIPILCTMLAYGFLIPQGNSKREQAISSVAKKYVMQIDGFKNRIDRILSE